MGEPVVRSEETQKEGTEDSPEDRPQTASELAAATVQIPTPYTPTNLIRTDPVFRPTVFLRDLQLIQKKLYLYLRGSITLYMDDTCKRMYSTWIKRLEKEKNLSEGDRFNLNKRISWEEIKDHIITTFAVTTLGSYNFLTLYITPRGDDVDFHEWCIKVCQIRETIIAHENWELVADRECLE